MARRNAIINLDQSTAPAKTNIGNGRIFNVCGMSTAVNRASRHSQSEMSLRDIFIMFAPIYSLWREFAPIAQMEFPNEVKIDVTSSSFARCCSVIRDWQTEGTRNKEN